MSDAGDEQAEVNSQNAEANPEEEPEEKLPEVNIDEETKKVREISKEGLSFLSKTADNVSFAYCRLEIPEKEIEGLYKALDFYPHLRYLNINNNKIRDISMCADLHYLVYLDCNSNEIRDITFLENPYILTYLQSLNLSKNKIKNCPSFKLARLKKLNLNENEISSLENISGHKAVKILEARKNKIKDLKGVENMASLQELYLGENAITTLDGIKNNARLKTLFLRANQISTVPEKFEGLNNMAHINLRDNQIGKIDEIKKLLQIETLKSITVHGSNPYVEEMKDLKTDLLIHLCLDKKTAELTRGLNRLNKEEIDDEAMQAAIDELKSRLEEEEARRVEEEQRLAEEAEAKRLEEEEAKRIEDEAKKLEEEARLAEEEEQRKIDEAARAEEEAKRALENPEPEVPAEDAKDPEVAPDAEAAPEVPAEVAPEVPAEVAPEGENLADPEQPKQEEAG